MTTPPVRTALVAGTTIALLVAGCGSDDTSNVAATTTGVSASTDTGSADTGAADTGSANTASTDTGSTGGYPISIDNCGVTITLDEAPQRVVAPSLPGLETTIAVGQVDRIAGTAGVIDNLLPEYRAEAEEADLNLISDGGFPPPTREAVLGADPDFIVSGYEFDFNPDALGDRGALAEDGLQSYLSEGACDGATVDDALTDIENYGLIFGVEDRARDLIDDLQADIDGAPVATDSPKVLVIQGDPAAPQTQGSGSMAADMVQRAGGELLFADITSLTEISWEQIIDAGPDVIIVGSFASAPGAETIEWIKGYEPAAEIPAVTGERFLDVNINDLVPGVRTGEAYVTVATAVAGG
ncbi:MAG: ABC transporter substrate-binding protein [Acidimicrobiales bacterium]